MSDLIYRQTAIDAVSNWLYDGDDKRSVDQLLSDLPSAQPEQQWISCSERLPEKCGVYLVSGSSRVWLCELVQIMTVCGWANDARNPVVTAWMPLPEPYSEEG